MRFLLLLIIFCSKESFAQLTSATKPVIDTAAIFSWTELGLPIGDDVKLSGDGHFVSYRMSNRISGAERVLQSVNSKKVLYRFPVDIECFFSSDNTKFVYLKEDKIVVLDIFSGHTREITGVSNMEVFGARKGELLIYKKKEGKKLIVENLLHHEYDFFIDSVDKYIFDKTCNKVAVAFDTNGGRALKYFDIRNDKSYTVTLSLSQEIESLSFNDSANSIMFVTNYNKDFRDRNIWLLNLMTGKAVVKVNKQLANLSEDEFINSIPPSFSADGRYIFFRVQKQVVRKKIEDAPKVDIWNYLDLKLKNGCGLQSPPNYTFSISTDGNSLIRLENDTLRLVGSNAKMGDYVILSNPIGDQFWKLYQRSVFWIVSMKDGSRSRHISEVGLQYYYYSPGGKYLLYADSSKLRWDYYSYNSENGVKSNLTKDIPASQLENLETNGKRQVGRGYLLEVVGWLPEENAVLIYDTFDLLKLFLDGSKKPQNLTNGYGRKNNIRFAITYANDKQNYYSKKDTLLLTAFNWNNKYNGFYSKSLHKVGNPDSVSMNPWVICGYGSRLLPINDHMMDKGMIPLKAADTNLWLVKCNSSNSAPNYYTTTDLQVFEKLTNIEPQRPYNWYITELVHWKQYDGTLGSGVLYKPENFNPNKKYPVIIFHYRELSQLLHYYFRPELTSAAINIPWFVSRGYLVLAPDVYVQENGSGPGAFNSVASAAEWLGTLTYVDRNKIGLNGHSQAGFQTNYIIAHTSIFAAALSGAGGADAILSSFINRQCGIERFQLSERRLGLIWEHPELYIKNSPFWLADRVTTPLLIFHCRKDEAVPWELSVQFFISLWRLGKRVWMLQYDESRHAISTEQDLFDYSKRVDQFFDHFLRGALPPEWMTKGVPSLSKGFESGLALDSGYLQRRYISE